MKDVVVPSVDDIMGAEDIKVKSTMHPGVKRTHQDDESHELVHSLLIDKYKKEQQMKAKNAVRRDRRQHEKRLRQTWHQDRRRDEFMEEDELMDSEESSPVAGPSNSAE